MFKLCLWFIAILGTNALILSYQIIKEGTWKAEEGEVPNNFFSWSNLDFSSLSSGFSWAMIIGRNLLNLEWSSKSLFILSVLGGILSFFIVRLLFSRAKRLDSNKADQPLLSFVKYTRQFQLESTSDVFLLVMLSTH